MRENDSGRLEIMQPRDAKDSDDEVEDPFHGENRLRILDIQERRPVMRSKQSANRPCIC